MPTFIPSSISTVYSTSLPTSFSSSNPTAMPTFIPSLISTVYPTSLPTSFHHQIQLECQHLFRYRFQLFIQQRY
jgi:hypothetical protein